jgi:hypothetical protein
MLIQEIVRSCLNESVAEAAVVSIGRSFSSKIAEVAAAYGMNIGAFTALSVDRFARHGDEGELRSVLAAMNASQEPVLAGLHRILCIMLAAGVPSGEGRPRHRMPKLTAQVCMMDVETSRRGAYC